MSFKFETSANAIRAYFGDNIITKMFLEGIQLNLDGTVVPVSTVPVTPSLPAGTDFTSLWMGSGRAGLLNHPNYPSLAHHTADISTAAGKPGGTVTTSFGATTNLGALTLAAGAVNVLSEDFRPGGSCDTFEKLAARYWFNTTTGTLTSVDSTNDPSHGASWGRMYCIPPVLPDGTANPFSTHVHTVDGLELRNFGRNNNAQPWTYANVVSGGLRSQINLQPNMCGELVSYQEDSDWIWCPYWGYADYQISPGLVPAANGDPYYGFPGANALWWGSDYTVNGVKLPNYLEPDFDDDFTDTGQLKGTQITSHWVHNNDLGIETFYYHIQFIANSDGYTASTDAGATNIGYKRLNYTGGRTKILKPHATQWNWYGNTLDILKDGVLVTRLYKEFHADTFTNLQTGQTDIRGLSEIIGGQWGSVNREDQRSNMSLTVDATKQRSTMITHKVWKGNFDLASYGTQPANLLPAYPDLILGTQGYQPGQQNTFNIKNLPQNYKAIATSSDGTVLTVTGAAIVGTFPALANGATPPSITVTAAPHVAAREDGKNGLGVMLTKTYPLTVGSNAEPVAPAKLPSEISGNLITSDAVGTQVGSTNTDGWSKSGSVVTSGQTDRSGTTKAFRIQMPAGGNLEFYKGGHPYSLQKFWFKVNAGSSITLSHYSPDGGTQKRTYTSAAGWIEVNNMPLGAGTQWNLFNEESVAADFLISDMAIIPT